MTSLREKDVFVVQSGSSKINDSIMELLILISACKGGSANKITGTNLTTRKHCNILTPLQPFCHTSPTADNRRRSLTEVLSRRACLPISCTLLVSNMSSPLTFTLLKCKDSSNVRSTISMPNRSSLVGSDIMCRTGRMLCASQRMLEVPRESHLWPMH